MPENVAEHWVYRHFGHSPYAFLPLQRLRFERHTWTNRQFDQVTFGDDWRWTTNDLSRLDHDGHRSSWLGANMIEHGTWPEPILIFDNASGLSDSSGVPMGRWHLLEGHQRLTYLRCLADKGQAKSEHDTWIVTLEPGVSLTTPAKIRGNVSPGYIRQKLFGAVESLAIESGTIQQRLLSACRGGPLHLSIDAFPSDKRDQWEELMDALGRVNDRVRGSMEASVELMSDREASHHARTILELYEWSVGEDSAIRSR